MILSSELVHAKTDSTDFIHALSLYSLGQTEEAFPLFERLFSDPKTSKEKRIRASFILSYAPQSLLHHHSRRFYAEFYLNSKKPIAPSHRSSLLRMIGDGYFDEMKLQEATLSFVELSKDPDLKNQAYAEYRLGWIELNQEKPAFAFSRWINFLAKNGSLLVQVDLELFRSLLRDTGRAWIEATESGGSIDWDRPQFASLLQVAKSDFIEGLVLGIKRVSNTQTSRIIQTKLNSTSLAQDVFNQLLKRGIHFGVFPCEISRWYTPQTRLESDQKESLLPYAGACAKQISAKKHCKTPEGLQFLNFFEAFELKGSELIPRISLSIECENWKSACNDLMDYLQHQAQKGHPLVPQTEETLLSSCLKSEESNRSDGAPRFLEPLVSHLTQNRNYFKDSSLPVTAASYVVGKPAGAQLLRTFGKAPVKGVWLDQLKAQVREWVSKKDFNAAHLLLEEHLPLTALTEENSNVWEYFWFHLEGENLAQQKLKMETWFQTLPLSSFENTRKGELFSLLLKMGSVEKIWEAGSTFDPWLSLQNGNQKNAALIALFYEKTLAALHSGNLLAENLDSYAKGRALLQVDQEDITLSFDDLIEKLGQPARSLPFAQDLKYLDDLKRISKTLSREKLKLNASLIRVLRSKLKTLEKEKQVIQSYAWFAARSRAQAESFLEKDSQSLIHELEEIETQLTNKPNLSEVLDQITQIKSQINPKLPMETPQ